MRPAVQCLHGRANLRRTSGGASTSVSRPRAGNPNMVRQKV